MQLRSVWIHLKPRKANPTANAIVVLQNLGRCRLVLGKIIWGKDFLKEGL